MFIKSDLAVVQNFLNSLHVWVAEVDLVLLADGHPIFDLIDAGNAQGHLCRNLPEMITGERAFET